MISSSSVLSSVNLCTVHLRWSVYKMHFFFSVLVFSTRSCLTFSIRVIFVLLDFMFPPRTNNYYKPLPVNSSHPFCYMSKTCNASPSDAVYRRFPLSQNRQNYTHWLCIPAICYSATECHALNVLQCMHWMLCTECSAVSAQNAL